MSKEQVMDYVMTTPSNPNRAVLSGMLDAISGTQLPSPTESDNGKVLGVDGGEYKLVEQSGGGTVELSKIKIASLVDGGNMLASWNAYASPAVATDSQVYTGTPQGQLLDGKSLAELIGNKKIVSLGFEVQDHAAFVMGGTVQLTDGTTVFEDILVGQFDDAVSQFTRINTFLMFHSSGTTSPSGKYVDIYAICI